MESRFPLGSSKARVKFILTATLFVWLVLVLRLAQIQFFAGPRYARMAAEQEKGEKILAGSRGLIFDRNGEVLAQNIGTYSFFSYAESLPSPWYLTNALFKGKLSQKEARAKKQRKGFVWLARRVEKEDAERIRRRMPGGIFVTPEETRTYPYQPLGIDWLGFMSMDGAGQSGLEFFYDSHLRGDSARLPLLRDARGQLYSMEKREVSPRPGKNLAVTIDVNMQAVLEKELGRGVEKQRASSGLGLFMNPRTGEILAMAYLPAERSDPRESRQKNRVIADIFEPGSTFKIVTATAALEEKKFGPRTLVFGENGSWKNGKHTLRDVHPYGWLSFEDAIVKSSNIALAKIGLAVGPAAFYETARKFGFGEKTGIDLPGEVRGQFPSEKELASPVRLASCSYGYGGAVTALQLVCAYGAVANGGVRMKPFIVKEIRDENGEIVQRRLPEEAERVCSKETAARLSRFFSGVVDSGTGQAASVAGVTVAGKTGTSKKIDPVTHRYAPGRYVSSFVGFFPAEQPRVVGLIALDEPKGAYFGGEVAAPIFKQVAEKILSLLEEPIPTERPKEDSEETIFQVASAASAPSIAESGLSPKKCPPELVPDFSGLSARRALEAAAVRGISARVKGKGMVKEQSIPPGSAVPPKGELVLSCATPFEDE